MLNWGHLGVEKFNNAANMPSSSPLNATTQVGHACRRFRLSMA
jgi:hypothetical protein